MFRKFLLVIAILLLGQKLSATHFVGGEISYTTSGNGTYNITLTIYKDCGAGTFGYPAGVTVNMLNTLTVLPVSSAYLTPGNEIAVPSPNDACVTNLPVFCVSKKVYTGSLTYTGSVTNGFSRTRIVVETIQSLTSSIQEPPR
mgnify:CR=1 FL=1|jgi:hypothetical protein